MGLVDAVVPHLAEPLRAQAHAAGGLEERLAALLTEAKASWPALSVADGAYLRHLAERLAADVPLEQGLDRLNAGDLYLACACSKLAPDAIEAFERRHLGQVRAALAALGPKELGDEICQQLMTKLFTSEPGRPPGISQYQGRGELSAWLQVVATRDAYKLIAKSRPRQNEIELLAERAIEVDDPELDVLKRTYRSQFKEAFAIAFQKLSPRDRNLLRHEYLDGLNIDRIGALYGVHRATAARWRQRVRTALFKHTRQVFEDELAIGREDFDSIVRLIQSQLDISLPRLLDPEKKD